MKKMLKSLGASSRWCSDVENCIQRQFKQMGGLIFLTEQEVWRWVVTNTGSATPQYHQRAGFFLAILRSFTCQLLILRLLLSSSQGGCYSVQHHTAFRGRTRKATRVGKAIWVPFPSLTGERKYPFPISLARAKSHGGLHLHGKLALWISDFSCLLLEAGKREAGGRWTSAANQQYFQ